MLELSKDITWKDRTRVLRKGETISKKTTLRHIKKDMNTNTLSPIYPDQIPENTKFRKVCNCRSPIILILKFHSIEKILFPTRFLVICINLLKMSTRIPIKIEYCGG